MKRLYLIPLALAALLAAWLLQFGCVQLTRAVYHQLGYLP